MWTKGTEVFATLCYRSVVDHASLFKHVSSLSTNAPWRKHLSAF